MATKFYPLTIKEVRRETPDTVSLSFIVPTEAKQYFSFIQGQYLTFRTTLNDEEIRRSYSICSAVGEELRVAVKKVYEGRFSTYANEVLKAGDILEAMPPQGRFYRELKPSAKKIYVAFAAGSGITPMLSIIKTTLATEPQSHFILFYGNRSFEYIIFRETLEQLKNLNPTRFSLHHILSRETPASPIFQGRIDGEKCKVYGNAFFEPKEVDTFFICGPEEMIFSVKDALETMGVDKKNILFELFTTPGTKRKASRRVEESTGFQAQISILQDGMRYDFMVPSDGSTILDAATRAGADLPYACKGGVCSTCRAKVVEGAVEMEVCYGLEADEVAAGYVLTCQAHPKTEKVVVSFDH